MLGDGVRILPCCFTVDVSDTGTALKTKFDSPPARAIKLQVAHASPRALSGIGLRMELLRLQFVGSKWFAHCQGLMANGRSASRSLKAFSVLC
jgi:hypothetical protein